jgi:hypothetical protein
MDILQVHCSGCNVAWESGTWPLDRKTRYWVFEASLLTDPSKPKVLITSYGKTDLECLDNTLKVLQPQRPPKTPTEAMSQAFPNYVPFSHKMHFFSLKSKKIGVTDSSGMTQWFAILVDPARADLPLYSLFGLK